MLSQAMQKEATFYQRQSKTTQLRFSVPFLPNLPSASL
jgi:hypothetical protein